MNCKGYIVEKTLFDHILLEYLDQPMKFSANPNMYVLNVPFCLNELT